MGFALADLDVPVTKTSGALTCFLHDPVKNLESGPCIRCGKCIEVCPQRLVPRRLLDIVLHGDMQRFQAEYGMECVACALLQLQLSGKASAGCQHQCHERQGAGGEKEEQEVRKFGNG